MDADSLCLRPLEDWLLEPAAFAAWEYEHITPGLIAVGAMGLDPGNEFFGACVKRLSKKWRVTNKRAWKTVGPQLITDVHKETRYDLTNYPAHYFYKSHHSGWTYTGSGPCFADQYWGSTYGYDAIT